MSIVDISLEDALEEVREFREAQPEAEDGWMSAKEWGVHWGCSTKRARDVLGLWKKAGRLLHDKRMDENLRGQRTQIDVYKLVEKE